MSADFGELFNATRSALDDILGSEGRQRSAEPRSAYAAYFNPAGGPFAGAALYAPAAEQGQPGTFGGPFAGQALYGRADQGQGSYGIQADPLSSNWFQQANQRVPKPQEPKTGLSGTAVEAGDWSGPATADDNRSLTPEKVDAWIAQTRPNSPLRGKGGYILQQANARGVSVPLFLGILLKESELGTTAGPGFNIAGLTDPARDQGLGGRRAFQSYGSWEQAIDGALGNLAGPNYKGKSAADQVSTWYVGKPYDPNATDLAGNGTVQQYLDGPVAAAYGGLGVPLNPQGAGTRKAAGARGDDTFPVVGWSGEIRNHWGTGERGATDIMAPSGTPIVAVRGGRVTWAGSDGLGGNNVLIHDDASGLDFYYAHMRDAPLVRAGQTVTAGAPLGYVGNTGDAAGGPTHLHLGIGYGIIQGGGASGGAGKGFDAVGFLQSIYGRGRRGGGGGQLTP
jgi:murein DD-endopeptidase MepM/ murein hydrolase activator NlpD